MERNVNALPEGYILGEQYQIGDVLGCGGFGITYLAWDKRMNRSVAVKELFPNKDVTRGEDHCTVNIVPGQEEYIAHIRKRFLEEAESLYRFCNQPDILNVYRLFEENNTAYYSMEYLEGTDLKNRLLAKGRMTWEELSVYMRMVLRALDALHRQNMIHRDISPDNIFLTKDGRAKLIDFGSLRSYNNSQGLTTILKHNFAPYEQYRSNGNQGPWTDIYALCVTMYYALGGVLPPKAPDRIMSDKTVPLNQLCPQLPEYVANAVMKGMAVFAEERFQNVEELYQQLYPNEVSQNRQPAQNQQPMQNRQPAQNQQPMQSRQSMQSRQPERWLRCVEGVNRGRQWRVSPGFVLQAGRDARCQINYPADTRGISRCQCSITMDANGHIYIKDENSSYGTFLNQTKLVPGRWYEYYPGTVILFAQERFVFG